MVAKSDFEIQAAEGTDVLPVSDNGRFEASRRQALAESAERARSVSDRLQQAEPKFRRFSGSIRSVDGSGRTSRGRVTSLHVPG